MGRGEERGGSEWKRRAHSNQIRFESQNMKTCFHVELSILVLESGRFVFIMVPSFFYLFFLCFKAQASFHEAIDTPVFVCSNVFNDAQHLAASRGSEDQRRSRRLEGNLDVPQDGLALHILYYTSQ